MHQPVERRQQRRPGLERLGQPVRAVEIGRVDPPLAADALDHRGLAGRADDRRLEGLRRPGQPGDAEGAQPPAVPFPLGLGGRDDRMVGVDPLGEVPQPLAALRARRPRPRRAPTMKSSSLVTFLLLVQPVDSHGLSQVSGSSRDGSGPSSRSRSRMSRRHRSLAATQSRRKTCQSLASPLPGPRGHLAAVEREILGRAQEGAAARSGAGPPPRPAGARARRPTRAGTTRPGRRSGRRR